MAATKWKMWEEEEVTVSMPQLLLQQLLTFCVVLRVVGPVPIEWCIRNIAWHGPNVDGWLMATLGGKWDVVVVVAVVAATRDHTNDWL